MRASVEAWDEPTALEAAAREARRAILAAAGAAVVLLLLLGPSPRRSYGPATTTDPVELDATIAAWLARAEDAEGGARGGRRRATTPGRPAARARPADDGAVAGALDAGGRLDLNAATAGEIDAVVPGFGRVLSSRLVEARPSGGWRSWDEIRAVEGIGPKRLEDLRTHARL